MIQNFVIPKDIKKIKYERSYNEYVLIYPRVIYDPETQKDLKDKKHIKIVQMSRLDYRKGKTVDEQIILQRLQK